MPLFLQPLSPQYVAFRIALGVKVFCSGCKALLNNTGLLELSFLPTQVDSASGLSPREKIKIDLSKEVKEFKYYVAGSSCQNEEASLKSSQDPTQRMSFLAMRVDLSMSSNSSYAEHYQPSAGDPSNSFILVVFGCDVGVVYCCGVDVVWGGVGDVVCGGVGVVFGCCVGVVYGCGVGVVYGCGVGAVYGCGVRFGCIV